MPPVATNKQVDSNTEIENTSVDFNTVTYPEESIKTNDKGGKSVWKKDFSTDIGDYDLWSRDFPP